MQLALVSPCGDFATRCGFSPSRYPALPAKPRQDQAWAPGCSLEGKSMCCWAAQADPGSTRNKSPTLALVPEGIPEEVVQCFTHRELRSGPARESLEVAGEWLLRAQDTSPSLHSA